MRFRGMVGTGLAACLVGGSLLAVTPGASAAAAPNADRIVSAMTLDEKIGQLLMPDFRNWAEGGGSADEAEGVTAMNPEIASIVRRYHLGGVILFAENVVATEQTVRLTRSFQLASPKVPLLVSIDQEGGIVTRLQSGTMHAGNMAVGATRSAQYAYQTGHIIGEELKALGINTNFAPVVDVNVNPANPVIGVRSFGSNPQLVATLGTAYAKGTNDAGTVATAKHFPGHGDTATDSHYGLPRVDKPVSELEKVELYPFQKAIDAGALPMIMTAHIQYPALDSTTMKSIADGTDVIVPATLSHKILTDLLRGHMGFDGVIVTDAMNMEGVAMHFGQIQASVKTLVAGADIALMPVTMRRLGDVAQLDQLFSLIHQAITAGDLTEAGIDKKVKRIIQLKIDQGLYDAQPSLREALRNARQVVGSPEHLATQQVISDRGVTLVRNQARTLPFRPARRARVLLLGPYDYQADAMAQSVQKLVRDGDIERVRIDDVDYENQQVIDAAAKRAIDRADYVIAGSYVVRNDPAQEGGEIGDPEDPEDWPITYPRSAMEYAQAQGKPFLVMSLRNPYDLANFPEADAALAVYNYKGLPAPNIPSGIRAAFGVVNPSGKLPVDVPSVLEEGKILYPYGFGLSYRR